jgi:hypothetical protein
MTFLEKLNALKNENPIKQYLVFWERRQYIGLVRQPGWLSPKSCKTRSVLRLFSGCCSETEVSEQLYYKKRDGINSGECNV